MSMMTVDDYLGLPYSRVTARSLTTNGNMCYVALRPELPGCRGQGKTPDKARENLDEATRRDMEAWTGCIAGALTREHYRELLEGAGFGDVEVQETHRVHPRASSAIIRARKPAGETL